MTAEPTCLVNADPEAALARAWGCTGGAALLSPASEPPVRAFFLGGEAMLAFASCAAAVKLAALGEKLTGWVPASAAAGPDCGAKPGASAVAACVAYAGATVTAGGETIGGVEAVGVLAAAGGRVVIGAAECGGLEPCGGATVETGWKKLVTVCGCARGRMLGVGPCPS